MFASLIIYFFALYDIFLFLLKELQILEEDSTMRRLRPQFSFRAYVHTATE